MAVLVVHPTHANAYPMFGPDPPVKHVITFNFLSLPKHSSWLCFFISAIRIFWSFDNNLNDLYNNYPGVGMNGPTYSSSGITGYGACLYLNATVLQSVTIYSPPFLNMAQTSFSLVAWVLATSYNNVASGSGRSDSAIFGQYESNTQDRSLHIIVRNQRIYLGFFSDDIQGNQILQPGVWYHVRLLVDWNEEKLTSLLDLV